MIDRDEIEEFFDRVCDRFTGDELVEILGLTSRDIVEMFRDHILEEKMDELTEALNGY